MPKAQDDETVLNLVELALAQPPDLREKQLRAACSGDPELFAQAWDYLEWEDRMRGFLLDPIYEPLPEHRFEPDAVLVDRFRILREVGEGGMGIVYEAFDEKLGRRIAIKVAKSGFRKRLPPEVLHASEISHPNICRIFEIHTASTSDGEFDFLTMEFLDGETLSARLRRGALSGAEVRDIARQICQGLAEAHRNHIVHGDLKAHNVIITRAADGNERAVITDFGLARGPMEAFDDDALATEGSSEIGGTPDYMAPELWRGGRPTAASDVYALGAILYELAERRHPFAGVPWQERTQALAPARTKWDRVVSRCLHADAAERFHEAAEVAQALEPSRRRQWWLAAAAAVTLAAGVGIVVYLRATTPQEAFRLAFLPLDTSREISALSPNLSQTAAEELTRLKGGKRARLTVIPQAEVTRRHVDSAAGAQSALRATHVVRGKLSLENNHFVLHAFVTDTRTQANDADWEFTYNSPRELRHAPDALAGMTSATLRLSPLPVPAVNASAAQDYRNGLSLTRRNSTVDRALPPLERAVQADPDSPLTWGALAQAQWFKYFVTRDAAWLQRTSESLGRAQSRDPDVPLVHLVAGLLRENAGSYEQAEAEYLRAIEEDPNYSDAYRYLGQARYRSGRFDQALAPLQKARELAPDYFKVYQELGTFYRRTGDREKATRQLEKAVALAPDEAEMHFALGTAYAEQYQLVEAERQLRTAMQLSPSSTPTLNNLGFVLMERENDRDAIPLLIQGSAGARDQYLALMNLGTAYRRIGETAKSTQTYERSFELAEKEISYNPRDALLRSRLAFLCARLGNQARAESEIGQALQLSPDDVNTRDMAVRVYETLNRRDDSIAMLRNSPDEVLLSARYWPDLADLHKESRFKDLLAQRGIK